MILYPANFVSKYAISQKAIIVVIIIKSLRASRRIRPKTNVGPGKYSIHSRIFTLVNNAFWINYAL